MCVGMLLLFVVYVCWVVTHLFFWKGWLWVSLMTMSDVFVGLGIGFELGFVYCG